MDKVTGHKSTSELKTKVLALLTRIPEGRVMTYGSIALAAGYPGAARQVGELLHGLSAETELPWQRVINAQGKISTYKVGFGDLQRALLESEGVKFDQNERCDLKKYAWFPKETLFLEEQS